MFSHAYGSVEGQRIGLLESRRYLVSAGFGNLFHLLLDGVSESDGKLFLFLFSYFPIVPLGPLLVLFGFGLDQLLDLLPKIGSSPSEGQILDLLHELRD